jgi:hypothetical protein
LNFIELIKLIKLIKLIELIEYLKTTLFLEKIFSRKIILEKS